MDTFMGARGIGTFLYLFVSRLLIKDISRSLFTAEAAKRT